jgi:hypothetical protein
MDGDDRIEARTPPAAHEQLFVVELLEVAVDQPGMETRLRVMLVEPEALELDPDPLDAGALFGLPEG